MATTCVSAPYRDPAVARPQAGYHRRTVSINPYALLNGTTHAVNDVWKVFKLPKGAKLVNGWYIESADIDSNATPLLTLDLKVTDGTTTKTIISATTIGQGGGVIYDHSATYGQQTGWVNYKTTSDDFYVYVTASAAAATLATGAVIVGCSYTLDTEPGE